MGSHEEPRAAPHGAATAMCAQNAQMPRARTNVASRPGIYVAALHLGQGSVSTWFGTMGTREGAREVIPGESADKLTPWCALRAVHVTVSVAQVNASELEHLRARARRT